MDELTSLDLDVILYLNYCQETDLPAPDLFDLADATKTDRSFMDIYESVTRLMELGYVRRANEYPLPLFYLNDSAECHKDVIPEM